MKTFPTQSRILVAIGVLVLSMLACGATAPAANPAALALSPTPKSRADDGPRTIPTLVPTYTRQPTHTPTNTFTPTPTRTPTRTPTSTPTRTATVPVPTPLPGTAANPGGTGLPAAGGTPQPASAPACTAPQNRTDLRGKIIFWSDRESDKEKMMEFQILYVMNADGSGQKRVSDDMGCAGAVFAYFQERLVWSNDRMWLLHYQGFGGGQSIMISGTAGQTPRRVTTLDGTNYDAAWAPDQARLAFVSTVDMNDEIYTTTIDGTKTRRLTFNTWEWDKHPTWSVDGKNIVFWSNRETGRRQIWVMRDDGQGQRNLSNNAFNDWDPIWIYP